MNNFGNLYRENRPVDIAAEHCFDVTLATLNR